MSGHGGPLRGMLSAARNLEFEGRFGRMFKGLPIATYGKTDVETTENLKALGARMESDDGPSDGADPEESAIPSLYTYLAQFIDHDLTLGPEGSFQKIRDPWALVDFRTAAFDLDCVYGRGPGDQPFLYDGSKLLLGGELHGGTGPAFDLPRNSAKPARALIGDPRNDENVIISEVQGLFLRFHNHLIDKGMSFHEAQVETQRHYQWVMLYDFLPRIVNADVLDGLKTNGEYDAGKIEFYKPKYYPFMPIEFSTAAYRFGHSMVRPGYRINDAHLLPLFDVVTGVDLRGKQAMDPSFGIDWARFIDSEDRAFDGAVGTPERLRRLQFAYKIDTSLVNPLAHLPENVADNPPPSLAKRNLVRSFDFGLPSGQVLANRMGVKILDEGQIVIGKATGEDTLTPIADINKIFEGNCPLWPYILAEAIAYQTSPVVKGAPGDGKIVTPQLGPVGGRIVAEVFLGLMFADTKSLLGRDRDPDWVPMGGADFKLKDFVTFAAPAVRTVGA